MEDYTYEKLAELAKSDPEQFEREAQRLRDDFIRETPDNIRHRLRESQYRFDQLLYFFNSSVWE